MVYLEAEFSSFPAQTVSLLYYLLLVTVTII